ncbi:MAG: NADH-quinone oxidoreductase subunit J [Thermoanaerobaculia bacterium]
MDAITSSIPFLIFVLVASVAVVSSVLVISMRNPVHSAIFLLITFLCVAVLFVMKSAEFVAAVQILVYAGGIMVLFLFVVMLINVRALPTERMTSKTLTGGVIIGLAVLAILMTLVRGGDYKAEVADKSALSTVVETTVVADPAAPEGRSETTTSIPNRNSEVVAMQLYREYLVPFEVVSLFLLVAMIGAIVIGKRELTAEEEETTPQFILDRAESEKEVKEAFGA